MHGVRNNGEHKRSKGKKIAVLIPYVGIIRIRFIGIIQMEISASDIAIASGTPSIREEMYRYLSNIGIAFPDKQRI